MPAMPTMPGSTTPLGSTGSEQMLVRRIHPHGPGHMKIGPLPCLHGITPTTVVVTPEGS
jgi:hypothetical protein